MSEGKHRSGWISLIVAACVVASVLIQCIGAWEDSQTTDEAVHLSAGVVYWKTGYFILNPEHPPLVKLLAAVPLLPFSWLNVPDTFTPGVEENQWILGATMLYRSAANIETSQLLMFLGRLPIILIWAALAALMWVWSKRLWGESGALLTIGLFLFDPTFLGHGHLVTTDVAAALAYTVCVFTLYRLLEEPCQKHWWWFAIAFGLAQVTKFSMLFLWVLIPFICLIALWRKQTRLLPAEHLRIIGAMLLGSLVITWVTYGFELRRPNDDPRVVRLWNERIEVANGQNTDVPHFVQDLVSLSTPGTPTGDVLLSLAETPIPAYSYWRGVFSILSHNYYGHGAYLWGEYSEIGWWWYFPAAMLFKTPFLTLLLAFAAVLGLGWRIRTNRTWPRAGIFLLIPPLAYLAWSMTSTINIGIRHILPIYPFIFIGLGGLTLLLKDRWKIPAVCGVLLISAAVAIRAYPNTIGYFNWLAGGTQGGHRYLLDSNLDWNQDIWRLKSWLQENQVTDYRLALFGSIPEHVLFPDAKPMLLDDQIESGVQPSGWFIISAGQLFNIPGPFHWLQNKQPFTRIGSSVFVYRF